jgi:hypothetical protein
MSDSEFLSLLFLGANFIIYLMRGITPFNRIWFVLKIFWMTLLAILMFNYLKDGASKK